MAVVWSRAQVKRSNRSSGSWWELAGRKILGSRNGDCGSMEVGGMEIEDGVYYSKVFACRQRTSAADVSN